MRHAGGLLRRHVLRDVARIEPEATVVSVLTDHRQKIALPASDIDDILVADIVPLDQPHRKRIGILLEPGREME